LPIGLQIIGKHFSEETILRAAFNFEQNNDVGKRKPSIKPAKHKEAAE
jgi:aspartyl-tRNA(Asn)/glutamyl-tRNA(Gln) amidotransferase subunit A